MNLGLLPPIGGSLTALQNTGQLARFAASYLPRYAEAFDQLYYCSYRNESPGDFPAIAFPPTFQVLPNRREALSHLYAWRMARHHAGPLATCHVLRIFQATGIVPGWLAKRRWRMPIAATYGYHYALLARRDGRQALALYYWLLSRLTFQIADAIIVTTTEIARDLGQSVPPNRLHLIPNGVDLRLFYPADAPSPGSPPTVLFLGRLTEHKDPLTLLRAAHRLQQSGRSIRLALVGDGPLRDPLVQEAQRLGLNVHFHGIVSHDRLPPLLRNAHAFVLPSHSEGHPKALLEAMACGLPVVVSDIPGNRSVVEPGENGLLFPPGDAAKLADQLETVLADHTLAERLGRAAYTTIAQHYDLNELIRREVMLLCGLVRKSPESRP